MEHFEVGPETIECESVTEPTVTLSTELQTALANGKFIDTGTSLHFPFYLFTPGWYYIIEIL